MNDIENALSALCQGKTLLYPTDTVWGLGCDATNFSAVKTLYELKKRPQQKCCICLVSDVNMLKKYIRKIPKNAYDIIQHSFRPTTIVYDGPMKLAENLIATDDTIAIRVVSSGFCNALISVFQKPIVSTSANYSGEKTPTNFKEISQQILENVGYAVTSHLEKPISKPSVIIKLGNDNTVKIIRK